MNTITYTLIVIWSSSGFWSNQYHEIKVEHIPTQLACDQAAETYRKRYDIPVGDEYTRKSVTCIAVQESK